MDAPHSPPPLNRPSQPLEALLIATAALLYTSTLAGFLTAFLTHLVALCIEGAFG